MCWWVLLVFFFLFFFSVVIFMLLKYVLFMVIVYVEVFEFMVELVCIFLNIVMILSIVGCLDGWLFKYVYVIFSCFSSLSFKVGFFISSMGLNSFVSFDFECCLIYFMSLLFLLKLVEFVGGFLVSSLSNMML